MKRFRDIRWSRFGHPSRLFWNCDCVSVCLVVICLVSSLQLTHFELSASNLTLKESGSTTYIVPWLHPSTVFHNGRCSSHLKIIRSVLEYTQQNLKFSIFSRFQDYNNKKRLKNKIVSYTNDQIIISMQ